MDAMNGLPQKLEVERYGDSISGYRSVAASWLMRGIGAGAILLMPMGALLMIAGAVAGGALAVGLGLLMDQLRMRARKQEARNKQRRYGHLLRWAEFTFGASEDKRTTFLFLLREFEQLSMLMETNKMAASLMKYLREWLERNDVQNCAADYVEWFFLSWADLGGVDLTDFQIVVRVCCAAFSDSKQWPLIYEQMRNVRRSKFFADLRAKAEEELEPKVTKQMQRRQREDRNWIAYSAVEEKHVDQLFREDMQRRLGRNFRSSSLIENGRVGPGLGLSDKGNLLAPLELTVVNRDSEPMVKRDGDRRTVSASLDQTRDAALQGDDAGDRERRERGRRASSFDVVSLQPQQRGSVPAPYATFFPSPLSPIIGTPVAAPDAEADERGVGGRESSFESDVHGQMPLETDGDESHPQERGEVGKSEEMEAGSDSIHIDIKTRPEAPGLPPPPPSQPLAFPGARLPSSPRTRLSTLGAQRSLSVGLRTNSIGGIEASAPLSLAGATVSQPSRTTISRESRDGRDEGDTVEGRDVVASKGGKEGKPLKETKARSRTKEKGGKRDEEDELGAHAGGGKEEGRERPSEAPAVNQAVQVPQSSGKKKSPPRFTEEVRKVPPVAKEDVFFQNLADLREFSPELKHQIPIGNYEFFFLDEFVDEAAGGPWELVVNKSSVKIYKQLTTMAGSDLVLIRGYADVEASVECVLWNIRETPRRTAWDTTFDGFVLVEGNIQGNEIVYNSIKAPWPVSSRDFLQWRKTEVDDKTGIVKILHRSADHVAYPADTSSSMIRAESIISAYIITPRGPRNCHLWLLTQADIRGVIPKWLVNSQAAKAPLNWIENLRKACKETHKKYGDQIPQYNPTPMYAHGKKI